MLIFFVGYARADVCNFQVYQYERVKIQTGQFQNGVCFISLNNNQNQSMIYKSHLFTSEGKHMVFNSFGNGPSHIDTGARVFLYLTGSTKLSFSKFQNRLYINVGLIQYELDVKSFEFIQAKGVRFYEYPDIHPMNQGGFEVLNADHSYIDFGFNLGQSPLWDLQRTFAFYQPSGKICSDLNQTILKRRGDEVTWIYPLNQLEHHLQETCQ
jgi:hypothetical protein